MHVLCMVNGSLGLTSCMVFGVRCKDVTSLHEGVWYLNGLVTISRMWRLEIRGGGQV